MPPDLYQSDFHNFLCGLEGIEDTNRAIEAEWGGGRRGCRLRGRYTTSTIQQYNFEACPAEHKKETCHGIPIVLLIFYFIT